MPKNRAAVLLGRKGGKERVKKLTAEQRSQQARELNKARWKDTPRCPCGQMTVKQAKRLGHQC
jgi:hypothetical protein